MSTQAGILYVVATPIGNLEDWSARAQRILADADLVLAEDTRRSGQLLRHFGITSSLQSYHDFNERQRAEELVAQLRAGARIALVSDAGTPLVSDPGYQLVRAARAAGIEIVAVPGPSALTAALSIAGLPTDRCVFEGFLPAKAAARRSRLEALKHEERTLVFFESPHRIEEALTDLTDVFGAGREAVVARELTKLHEETLGATLGEIRSTIAARDAPPRGELVIVVHGAAPAPSGLSEARRLFDVLRRFLPPGQAAAAVAEFTGLSRQLLYADALDRRDVGAET